MKLDTKAVRNNSPLPRRQGREVLLHENPGQLGLLGRCGDHVDDAAGEAGRQLVGQGQSERGAGERGSRAAAAAEK